MTFTHRGISLLSLGAAWLAAACGSDSDCEDTRTCGGSSTGGGSGAGGTTGGTGAAGGTGGTGAIGATGGVTGGTGGTATTCTLDAQCDDGKACNGKETCDSGSCKAGTVVVCTNPDAAHCDATCVETGAGASNCKIAGKDADGDTHLDAACAASVDPAKDCDDTLKSVYPGASEICDGLDNDCDGKDELDTGAALGGGATDFVKNTATNATTPAIVWSPTKQYGVVWSDDRDGNFEIYFARMSPDGTKVGSPPVDELRVSNHAASSTVPRIAWGNNAYGITWQDPHGATAEQVYFRAMDTTGAGKTGELQVSSASAKAETPDIAALPTGWVVVWADRRSNTNGEIYARVLNADGTGAAAEKQIGTQGGTNILPRVASNGTEILVTWSHRDFTSGNTTPNVVKVLRLGLDLAVKAEQAISANTPASGTGATTSVVAPTSTGWAFGWQEYATSKQLRMHEIKADLTADCNAATLPVAELVGPGGIAVRGTSRLVAYRNGVGLVAKVRALRFKNGCAGPVPFELGGADIPDMDASHVDLAWSDSSAVMIWDDQISGSFSIRRWAAGPNLCDAPKP